MQIASARGNIQGHGHEGNVEMIKEKDKVIEQLKNQLKATEGKGKGGLSLLGASGHKHTPSENGSLDLKQENE